MVVTDVVVDESVIILVAVIVVGRVNCVGDAEAVELLSTQVTSGCVVEATNN